MALRASGVDLEPGKFGGFLGAPRGLALALAGALLRSRFLAPSIGGHAAVSRDEMRVLIGASLERARVFGAPHVALEGLLEALEKSAPTA